jgi:myo-inositol-1(or 4)-monophosphatase
VSDAGDELCAVATALAREAGALLRERFEAGTERVLATKTTPTDLVSEADLASQRAIRDGLARVRPDDGFLGEEGGDEPGTSGLRWIVDPLDGTVNFLFGIPQWCVSIAVRDEAGTVAGAVFDPMREELFCATRDGEASLNGRTLAGAPGRAGELGQAMVATGFAYDATVRAEQGEVLGRLIPRVRDVRRFGSAALDLSWTAAGRYDAYFERTVKPWDVAAGALICERAGLALHDLPATATLPYGLLAAVPAVAGELLALVA